MSYAARIHFRRRARVRAQFFASLVSALFAATCTSGDAPLSPNGFARANHLAIRPEYVVLGGHVQTDPINRIHLLARAQPSQVVLADTILDVSPTDASWNLGIDLRLPENQENASVVVTIELINSSAAGERVQWSGETAPITVTLGATAPSPPPVLVFPGPPSNLTITGVSITTDSVSIIEGDSALMNASVTGATGTPVVIWSTLDPAVAAVSPAGHVRGVRNGTARVVAQAGPKADTTTVRFAQRLAGVNIIQDSVELASVGEEVTLSARGMDPRGDSIPGTAFSFEIRDGSVVEEAGAARFRARADGRTFIIATSAVRPALRDSAVISVTQRIANTVVTPLVSTISAIGGTAQLGATARDARGNEMPLVATWSTDNAAVASVDGTGLVRALSNGTAHISATFPGGSPTAATITVAQQAAFVDVTPASSALSFAGDTVRATAVVRDGNANIITGAAITWSTSDAAVATVDLNGLVRAVGAGSAVITARAGSASGASGISVTQRATRVTIAPRAAAAVSLGEAVPFSAVVLDAGNTTIARPALAWHSSNPAIATVDAAGVASAVSNGTAYIVAETDGVRDSVAFTVRQAASRITLASAPDSVAIGDTLRIRATALDARDNVIASPSLEWSTAAPAVATVNAAGVVTGVAAGRAEISVSLVGVNAIAHITVFQGGPAAVVISPRSLELDALDATATLTAAVRDGRGVPLAGTALAWTSTNPAVAAVDGNGVVQARGEGTARIAVRAGTVADTIGVVVAQVAVSLVVQPDSAQINAIIGTAQLTVNIRDRLNNEMRGARPSWLSLNPGVAVVDTLGVVRAISNGQAKIVAAFDGHADTSNIRVAAGSPNLVAVPFVVMPGDTLREGVPSTVAVKIRNTGTSASTPALVYLRLRQAATGPVLATDSTGIPGIPAGDSILIPRVIMIDSVTPYPDSVFAAIQVDANNNVAESDESDNSYGRTLRIMLSVARVQVMNATGMVPVDSLLFDALGDTVQLTAKAFDRFSRPIAGRRVFWTQLQPGPGPSAAGVDTLGRVRPFNAGTILLGGGIGTRIDTFMVRVAQAPVALNLMPDSLHLIVGDSARIDAHATDRNNFFINGALPAFVNTNPAVASFDTTRFVRGSSAGVTIVHGTLGALHDSVIVRVHNAGPTGHVWNGSQSSSWTDPANWSPAGVPLPTDTVFIPSGTTPPVLTAPVTVGRIGIGAGATLDLATFVLTVQSNASIEGNLIGSAGVLRMTGTNASLHVTALSIPSLQIQTGSVLVPLPLNINGSLSISNGGDLNVGSTQISAQSLSVTGAGRLTMNGPDGVLTISGDATFEGAQTVGSLNAGTFRVGGNLVAGSSSFEGFAASGSHLTILNGATPQNVSFAYPVVQSDRQHFAHLRIENATGVTFLTDAAALGTVTIAGGVVGVSGPGRTFGIVGNLVDLTATGVWNVSNTTMFGSMPSIPAHLTTNLTFRSNATVQDNYNLTGSLVVDGGGAALDLNGKTVNVTGDVRATNGAQLRIGSGTITGLGGLDVIGNLARLRMDDPAGVLSVRGNATFEGANTLGSLTAGTLRIGGNLTAGSSSFEGFIASGTHVTVLDGTARQSVVFAYPQTQVDRQHFQDLQIENPAGVSFITDAVALGGVTLVAGTGFVNGTGRTVTIGASLLDAAATGSWQVDNTVMLANAPVIPANLVTNLTFRGNATLQNNYNLHGTLAVDGAAAILDLNGKTVSATGGIRVSNGAELSVGSGVILAGGNLEVVGSLARLRMQDPNGLLVAGGSALFEGAQTVGLLTAGTLTIGGNFTVGSSSFEGFSAGGSHLTILNGNAPQTILFAYPSTQVDRNHFQNLEITNQEGVDFGTNAVALGRVVVAAGVAPVTGAGRTVTIGTDLLDPATTGSWQVGNTVMLGAAPHVPANLQTDLTFRGVAVLQNDFSLTGALAVDGVGNSLDLSGRTVTASGNVRALNGATLVVGNGTITAEGALEVMGVSAALSMTDAAGVLAVRQGATFEGANTVGKLTAGTLRVGGNFLAGSSSFEAFSASGSHLTHLDGTAPQTVAFAYPSAQADRQHFHNLLITNPAGITFGTVVAVNGAATVDAAAGDVTGSSLPVLGGVLSDPGTHWRLGSNLTLSSVQIAPADNLFKGSAYPVRIVVKNTGSVQTPQMTARLVITEALAGTPPQLVFTDYLIATILPGDSVVHNDVLPINPLLAVDSIRATLTLDPGATLQEYNENDNTFSTGVIHLLAPLPLGSPGITKTWLGSTNAWSTPTNWSPAGVPTSLDTVLISAGTPSQPAVGSPSNAGGIVVASGAQLTLNATLSAWGAVVAEGAITGPAELVLQGAGAIRGTLPGVVFSSARTVAATATINGNVTIGDGGNLTAAAPLTITGNLTWDSNGFLTMNDPLGDVTVHGNFYANRSNGAVPTLSAGTLRVKGNFATGGNSSEVLRATGTHKVILAGTAPQTLAIAYGGDGRHYFNDIEFANSDSVIVTNQIDVRNRAYVTMGTVVGATTAHVVNGIVDAAGNRWRVGTTRIAGPSPVLPAALTTNLRFTNPTSLVGDVTLNGSITIEDGADFRLNGHTARVLGNVTLNSTGFLTMNNSADLLNVAGDIFLNRTNGFVPVFNAGEIRIQGNFATGGNSSETFRATGSHKVVFDGTGRQTVSLAYGDDQRHYFNNIEFANPDSVHVLAPIWINGSGYINAGKVVGDTRAHVRDGVVDATGNRWQIRTNHMFGSTVVIPRTIQGDIYFDTPVALGTDIHVTGEVRVNDGANLRLNGHTMRVDSTFVLDGTGFLTMVNDTDTLDVGRSVYFNRSNGAVPVFSAGVIRVQGDFSTGGNSSEAFRATGTHRVLFNGTVPQSISLSYGDDERHYFNDVIFANPDSVIFTRPVWVNGVATISAGKVVGAVTAHLRNGVSDAVGDRWRVATTHFLGLSSAVPTSLVGNVFFTTPVALPQDVTLTGNVSILDGGDLRPNGHTFRVIGDFTLNSSGFLTMNNAGDVLDVSGNIYMNRSNGAVPVFSAGLIKVQGNFETGGNSGETFRPTGTHRVLFNGTGMQTISLAYGDDERHYFNDITFANPDSVRLSKALWVNGIAAITQGKVVGPFTGHLRNGVTDSIGNRWRVASTHLLGANADIPTALTSNVSINSALVLPQDMTISGSLTLADGAQLSLAGNQLAVGGDFTLNSTGKLTMNNAADVLDVRGNVFMNRTDGFVPVFSAGEVRVGGNFATGGNSGETFRATGTHRVVFDGTTAQSVALAYGADGRHYFRNVEIRNSTGVTFTSSATVRGDLTNASAPAGSRLNVATGVTVDVAGALSLQLNSVAHILGTLLYGSYPISLGTFPFGGNLPQLSGGTL